MCEVHTTTSFTGQFPSIQHSASKMVFPYTPCISKFSFSIPERNQELFRDQLPGKFLQNLSFQVAWTPAILFSAILVFLLTSTIKERCSSCSPQDEMMGDGELRFAFVIQLQSLLNPFPSFSLFVQNNIYPCKILAEISQRLPRSCRDLAEISPRSRRDLATCAESCRDG